MKNTTKFNEEQAVMDLLRSQYSGFPPGRIIPSESPDFVLQTGRHYRIGIEITRLTKGPISALLPSAQSNRFTLQDINYAMSRKEEKRTLYQKKRLNELWLVLVAGLDASSSAKLPANLNTIDKIPLTGFNKVFLIEMISRKVRLIQD